MKLRYFLLLIIVALSCLTSHAKAMFPDCESDTNAVERGVEGISRLCPTGMWDHWTFRDIAYDKENNTVVFIIQLASWDENRSNREVTPEEAKKQTEWIVKNIMEGYNELIKSPHILCDGDFMLYLSLGTLLKQMEKNGTNLRITLLKPEYESLAIKDIPMTLTSSELRPILTL